jgi:predicted RNase H-like HicB family nuclease
VISHALCVVIEQAENNYSAYVLDLPGCVASGSSIAETKQAIREAIEFHIEGLREDGEAIPQPTSRVDYVEVAA